MKYQRANAENNMKTAQQHENLKLESKNQEYPKDGNGTYQNSPVINVGQWRQQRGHDWSFEDVDSQELRPGSEGRSNP
jgi:hypothetical protein